MKRGLNRIIRVMDQAYGRDISPYDETFLAKSIDRRLAAAGVKTFSAYGAYLSENRAEAEVLSDSLNISYSEFFRNPLTFALMEQLILPDLVEKKSRNNRGEIRILVAGCAGGQEAYSIAILAEEATAVREDPVLCRIFAVDLSKTELARAQAGSYSTEDVGNVCLRRLNACFSRRKNSFIVAPRIRKRVIFSLYDLLDKHTTSPPDSIFGDFDLVLCCNVLLYYRPETQRLILDKIRRCLSPGGYLVVGWTEHQIVKSAGGFRSAFPPATVFRPTHKGG
ncbi:MAG TPA: protein-glutamate O-methyltransferase CheR [Proteobacteria bacterium]|nr:chemotaxis protein methyltransferase Cher2 [bacterium BMS3Abin14]HDL52709.1 protein-glutamate O-methyltransferase CheR [Pseudomonadota bacterium]